MLHAKFQDRRTSGSGDLDHLYKILPSFQRRLHMKFGQAVSEEKMFEHCGRRTDDGRRSMGILLAHRVSLKAQVS